METLRLHLLHKTAGMGPGSGKDGLGQSGNVLACRHCAHCPCASALRTVAAEPLDQFGLFLGLDRPGRALVAVLMGLDSLALSICPAHCSAPTSWWTSWACRWSWTRTASGARCQPPSRRTSGRAPFHPLSVRVSVPNLKRQAAARQHKLESSLCFYPSCLVQIRTYDLSLCIC